MKRWSSKGKAKPCRSNTQDPLFQTIQQRQRTEMGQPSDEHLDEWEAIEAIYGPDSKCLSLALPSFLRLLLPLTGLDLIESGFPIALLIPNFFPFSILFLLDHCLSGGI